MWSGPNLAKSPSRFQPGLGRGTRAILDRHRSAFPQGGEGRRKAIKRVGDVERHRSPDPLASRALFPCLGVGCIGHGLSTRAAWLE
ncbi:hypothetical protein C27AD_05988 [Salinisphaera hydrothermalis C27AD]